MNTAAAMRAVECVVSFFLIGFLGYVLTKRRWFSAESASMLARLVTGVIIPANLFHTINTSTTKADFLPLLGHVLLPLASILIVMLLSAVFARVIGMEHSHKNIFITAAACSNTMNIGLPVNLALFGTEAVPAILIYYMGGTIVFWTFGNSLLAAGAPDAVKTPVLGTVTLRRFFSPPVWALCAGLLLLVLNVKIPPLIGIACGQVGSMITPLSIICIGIAIYQTGLRNIRVTRDVALVAVYRFVASPLVLVCLLHFFPVPEMMRNVFIIQSSLPPMANIALLAFRYRIDSAYASVSIAFCTLCAIVTVPAFMILLTSF